MNDRYLREQVVVDTLAPSLSTVMPDTRLQEQNTRRYGPREIFFGMGYTEIDKLSIERC